jgi:hypothetical protein
VHQAARPVVHQEEVQVVHWVSVNSNSPTSATTEKFTYPAGGPGGRGGSATPLPLAGGSPVGGPGGAPPFGAGEGDAMACDRRVAVL